MINNASKEVGRASKEASRSSKETENGEGRRKKGIEGKGEETPLLPWKPEAHKLIIRGSFLGERRECLQQKFSTKKS